ncbi:MAG: ribonuclease Z [Arenicella sp.]|jgi:ribonuclease Z
MPFFPQLKSLPNEDISILFTLDNHSDSYLCECGEASGLSVKDCQNVRAIFISHTHIDHFIGFDKVLRHQLGIGKRVIICGPKGIAKQVQAKVKSYLWNLATPDAITYEIREIITTSQIETYEIQPPTWELKRLGTETKLYENERFSVDFAILDHKTDSIAYHFKEQDSVNINLGNGNFRGGKWINELKQAYDNGESERQIKIDGTNHLASALFHLLEVKKGDSLGVIMDHGATESNHSVIKTHFANSNQVFIESFYKLEDKEKAEKKAHSYSSASGKIMQECHVENAIPVHFSRKYNEEDIQILIGEFEKAYRLSP